MWKCGKNGQAELTHNIMWVLAQNISIYEIKVWKYKEKKCGQVNG